MSLVDEVIGVAHRAGNAILNVYDKADLDVEFKSDRSPITRADIVSNEIITTSLKELADYPIVSEETPVEFDVRRHWETFWLIDPLDGTKNFINKQGEFTVNIALIEQTRPILGVIHAPVLKETFYARENQGAFKNGERIFNKSNRKNLIAADSISHSTPEMAAFFKTYQISNIEQFGASLKLCRLAEGVIDVYPRLNGTSEWDTAAGQVIAQEAGCKLIDVKSCNALTYNKKSMRNNHFIASRDDLSFSV